MGVFGCFYPYLQRPLPVYGVLWLSRSAGWGRFRIFYPYLQTVKQEGDDEIGVI